MSELKVLMKEFVDLKHDIEQKKAMIVPLADRLKELSHLIGDHLAIEDGEETSESVSFPKIGSVVKKRHISANVTDWEKFQKFCTDNGAEFAMRKQLNLSGVRELHRLMMQGDLDDTDSVEFGVFDKVYIRRK